MQQFIQIVTNINSAVNRFAWGPVMLALLVGTGVYLSWRTQFLQVRRFIFILKSTLGSLFSGKKAENDRNLSPF